MCSGQNQRLSSCESTEVDSKVAAATEREGDPWPGGVGWDLSAVEEELEGEVGVDAGVDIVVDEGVVGVVAVVAVEEDDGGAVVAVERSSTGM